METKIYKNTNLENLEGEIWKDIKGYEGYFQISNMGRVKSLHRYFNNNGGLTPVKEKIRKQAKDTKGYLRTELSISGKGETKKIHRLVAEAFIPNSNNLPQVNHIDEIKTNNVYINLEWISNKDNVNDGSSISRSSQSRINHPLRSKVVLQYDLSGKFIKEYPSVAEASRQNGNNRHIGECCSGQHETACGFIWKFKGHEN